MLRLNPLGGSSFKMHPRPACTMRRESAPPQHHNPKLCPRTRKMPAVFPNRTGAPPSESVSAELKDLCSGNKERRKERKRERRNPTTLCQPLVPGRRRRPGCLPQTPRHGRNSARWAARHAAGPAPGHERGRHHVLHVRRQRDLSVGTYHERLRRIDFWTISLVEPCGSSPYNRLAIFCNTWPRAFGKLFRCVATMNRAS